MKGEALKELQKLADQKKREKHPTMPEHAIPKTKYTDQTTNGLTLAVVDCFKLHGLFATRIDSKGTYNQGLKRFIPSTQKKGLPDVFAQAAGLPPLWIEIKCEQTNDRIKPHQEETIRELRESGAVVYVAGNFEDFYDWFNSTVLKRDLTDTLK